MKTVDESHGTHYSMLAFALKMSSPVFIEKDGDVCRWTAAGYFGGVGWGEAESLPQVSSGSSGTWWFSSHQTVPTGDSRWTGDSGFDHGDIYWWCDEGHQLDYKEDKRNRYHNICNSNKIQQCQSL